MSDLTCPSCGASIPGDARMCPGCGCDLDMASLIGSGEPQPRAVPSGSNRAVRESETARRDRVRAGSRRRGPGMVVLLVALGCAALALGAMVLWMFLSEQLASPPPPKPMLVLDWPVKERFSGRVIIDGRSVRLPGDGPIQYPLELGKHTVVLSREGCASIKIKVAVEEPRRYVYKPEWKLVTLAVPEEATPSAVPAPPGPKEVSPASPQPSDPGKRDP